MTIPLSCFLLFRTIFLPTPPHSLLNEITDVPAGERDDTEHNKDKKHKPTENDESGWKDDEDSETKDDVKDKRGVRAGGDGREEIGVFFFLNYYYCQ